MRSKSVLGSELHLNITIIIITILIIIIIIINDPLAAIIMASANLCWAVPICCPVCGEICFGFQGVPFGDRRWGLLTLRFDHVEHHEPHFWLVVLPFWSDVIVWRRVLQ